MAPLQAANGSGSEGIDADSGKFYSPVRSKALLD